MKNISAGVAVAHAEPEPLRGAHEGARPHGDPQGALLRGGGGGQLHRHHQGLQGPCASPSSIRKKLISHFLRGKWIQTTIHTPFCPLSDLNRKYRSVASTLVAFSSTHAPPSILCDVTGHVPAPRDAAGFEQGGDGRLDPGMASHRSHSLVYPGHYTAYRLNPCLPSTCSRCSIPWMFTSAVDAASFEYVASFGWHGWDVLLPLMTYRFHPSLGKLV